MKYVVSSLIVSWPNQIYIYVAGCNIFARVNQIIFVAWGGCIGCKTMCVLTDSYTFAKSVIQVVSSCLVLQQQSVNFFLLVSFESTFMLINRFANDEYM